MRYALRDHAGGFATETGTVEDLPTLLATFERVKPATVVHAASNVEVAKLFRDPYVAFQTNVTGTLNVLEAARRTGVRRVVDISSIGVLPAIQYEPIDAAHPIMLAREGPGSGAYGAAKASGELFAFAFQRAYGLDVRIVRPSAVYGFGMQQHSANYMKEFVEPAVRGEQVKLPSGGRLPRDYTHVEDVASLTVRVVDCDEDADRIFYAATGEPLVTAAQAARLVAELIPGSSIEVGGRDDRRRRDRGFLPRRHLDRKCESAARLGAALCCAAGRCPGIHRDLSCVPGRAAPDSCLLTKFRVTAYCSTIVAYLQDHAGTGEATRI